MNLQSNVNQIINTLGYLSTLKDTSKNTKDIKDLSLADAADKTKANNQEIKLSFDPNEVRQQMLQKWTGVFEDKRTRLAYRERAKEKIGVDENMFKSGEQGGGLL